MFSLPIFVGFDYHQKMVQVCVMDQKRNILLNQTVENAPEAVLRVVAPHGSNVHAAIGMITAITMRALIGRFDRFHTGKQLINFCAVTPRNNSSGGKTTTGG